MNNLKPYEKELLALVASALDPSVAASANPDLPAWPKIRREARAQQVAALTYHTAEQRGADQLTLEKWKRTREQSIGASLVSARQHADLHRIMERAGIPYVILKGRAAAAYYPDPILRMSGDVDFLVAEENLARAADALRAEGFRLHEHDHDYHWQFYKGRKLYELHWAVTGTPTGPNGDVIRSYIADMIAAAETYEDQGMVCRVPAPRHHAIVLLVHTAGHIKSSGIGLRQICDWAAFVRCEPEKLFTETLMEPLKAMGLWKFAQILTNLCTAYLGLPHQSWADVTDPDYLEHMMKDILASGDAIGQSSARDSQKRWYVMPGKGTIGKGDAPLRFIGMLNESAHMTWPATKKIPVLLPFAWGYVGMRYLFRVGRGTRPTFAQSARNMRDAMDRRTLYSTWKLFEPETESAINEPGS